MLGGERGVSENVELAGSVGLAVNDVLYHEVEVFII